MGRRVRICIGIAIGLLGFGAGPSAPAETGSVELMTGSADDFPTALTVHQSGYPDIHTTAHYDTRPFRPDFPYDALRISRRGGDEAWEFGQLHHCLCFANPPTGIQYSAIHLGYNYFLFGCGCKREDFGFHLAAGPILTNPDTTLRNQHRTTGATFFDGGWYYSGIALETSAEKDFHFTTHAFCTLELALTTGFAWHVPIANGSANAPNVALHGHLGVGYNFSRPRHGLAPLAGDRVVALDGVANRRFRRHGVRQCPQRWRGKASLTATDTGRCRGGRRSRPRLRVACRAPSWDVGAAAAMAC